MIDSTWRSTDAGRRSPHRRAYQAPESEQDAAARQLWDGGRGAGHWRQCL